MCSASRSWPLDHPSVAPLTSGAASKRQGGARGCPITAAMTHKGTVMAHILVIEDDPATADHIVASLQAHGHVTTHVADGDLGLERATREPFDAATLDRMLPGRDGLSVVAALRARRIALPVLMISALGDVDERIAGLRAGGDDYLVKPFAPEEMAMRIEVLLRRREDPANAAT